MTLIEALKTGKCIRRYGWFPYPNWMRAAALNFSAQDVLADDWEVEPEEPRFSKKECLVIISSLFSAHIITLAAHDSFVHYLKEKE